MAKQCKKCNGSGTIYLRGGGREYGCSQRFEGGRYETCPRCKGTGEEPGCLVSTAICGALGKSDDCCELTELRAFRDNYLMCHDWGKELVLNYYDSSPALVEVLTQKAEENPLIFEALYRNHLMPVLSAIRAGRYEEAIEAYRCMLSASREM